MAIPLIKEYGPKAIKHLYDKYVPTKIKDVLSGITGGDEGVIPSDKPSN